MAEDLSKKAVVVTVPGMDAVTVRRDLPYREGLTFDLYAPAAGAPAPVVVFINGFPDPGGRLKSMTAYGSWGRLVAASGLAAVTYATAAPVADLDALLAHLGAHAAELGLDAGRVAVWAASGRGPVGVHGLRASFRCAVLCYPYLMDDGSGALAEAAKAFFMVVPAGKTMDDVPPELPILLVRAGADALPGLSAGVERFVAEALRRDLPLTLVNLRGAPHAFDLADDRPASRDAVRDIVAFLARHLA
jgi:fermentation-respiration switch protein FrsA (DUF1100 family)